MKLLNLVFLLLIISCNLKKTQELHGISNLKTKINEIRINFTNQNDISELLGPPIIKDVFDKNIWSYYEVIKSSNFIGTKTTIVNDILILKFNTSGILIDYETYDINTLKKITFDKDDTKIKSIDDDFLKNILSSTKKRLDMIKNKSNLSSPNEQ